MPQTYAIAVERLPRKQKKKLKAELRQFFDGCPRPKYIRVVQTATDITYWHIDRKAEQP
jgi:hypothetical protein